MYICPGVAGNNAPTSKEVNLVVNTTGATLISSLSESDVPDPTKTIVIVSNAQVTTADCSLILCLVLMSHILLPRCYRERWQDTA
jgi:hypothetical protein